MRILCRCLGRGTRRGSLLVLLLTLVIGLVGAAAAEVGNGQDSTVRIVLAGDVMLDGGPGHAVAHGEDPFADLAPILKNADIAVCNLECVVTEHEKQVLKPYTFRARPECIAVLGRYFSAVCLARATIDPRGSWKN